MKKHDTLLILDRADDLFAKFSANSPIDVTRAYETKNIFLKILRRLHLISRLPLFNIWLGPWKKDISNYKTVLIHASKLKLPIVKYAHSKNPLIRIIFWYWNPVETTVHPDNLPDYCEKWSFDPSDCEEYDLRYNTQFYFDEIKTKKVPSEWDILFVGKDKGRFEELMGYKKQFVNFGLICNFLIMPDTDKVVLPGKKYTPYMPYKRLLSNIEKTKAILDIVDSRQTGLTLRPLEAMFHEKKLITNHKLIVEYDFYDNRNIFILGIDDLNQLPAFLSEPYVKPSKSIVKQYDFDNWLQRFEERA